MEKEKNSRLVTSEKENEIRLRRMIRKNDKKFGEIKMKTSCLYQEPVRPQEIGKPPLFNSGLKSDSKFIQANRRSPLVGKQTMQKA